MTKTILTIGYHLYLAMLVLHSPAPADAAVGCGTASLKDFCAVIGQDFTSPSYEASPHSVRTMRDIRDEAKKAGVALVGVAADVDALERLQGPKIVHLAHPEHFTVLLRMGADVIQLMDSGRVLVMARDTFIRRYTGRALVRQANDDPVGPWLGVSDFCYTFGITGVGQKVSHSFGVVNRGQNLLVLSPQATGQCGAPRVVLSADHLHPGERAEVEVSYHVANASPTLVSAKLLTNDPDNPVVFFTLYGTAPRDLCVYPDRLFVVANKGDSLRASVVLTGPAGMDVKGVSCGTGLLSPAARIVADDPVTGRVWQIAFSLKNERYTGQIVDELRVDTTHKERSVVTVPIRGEIRGDLIRPSSLFLGFILAGEKTTTEIVIRHRRQHAFRIGSVRSSNRLLRVHTPAFAEGLCTIPITIDTSSIGLIQGVITADTDVTGEETIGVPVYAHVVKK